MPFASRFSRRLLATATLAALLTGCSEPGDARKPEATQTSTASASNVSPATVPATPVVPENASRATIGDSPRKEPNVSKQYPSAPAMTIDKSKKYTATFETSRGTIVVDLFTDRAPVTVNNFVFLAKDGFYDGTEFHRVINDFMVQGGDPTASGRGGPGYKWNDERSALGIAHEVGSLSMANAGPNTNGSQFFITHIATDWLNGKHAVFGKVRTGQDIVNATKQGDTLKKVTITEE